MDAAHRFCGCPCSSFCQAQFGELATQPSFVARPDSGRQRVAYSTGPRQRKELRMPNEHRLYELSDLPTLLKLSLEKVEHLVRTGQLLAIRICGEYRIDSKEVDGLIETYSQIAKRKQHAGCN